MRFSSSDCCLWLCLDRAWTDRICSLAATADDGADADLLAAALPPPPPFRAELGATRSLRELRGKLSADIDNNDAIVVACTVHLKNLPRNNELLAVAQNCEISSFGPIYQPVNNEVCARGTGGLGCMQCGQHSSHPHILVHDVPFLSSLPFFRSCQDCCGGSQPMGYWGM